MDDDSTDGSSGCACGTGTRDSSVYAELQRGEMEALASIFGDEFKQLDVPKERAGLATARYSIRVVPYSDVRSDASGGGGSGGVVTPLRTSGGQHGNFAVVLLDVSYPPNYPDGEPTIVVEKVRGLSNEHLEELRKIVQELLHKRVGFEVIFDVAQCVQDFLLAHNKKVGSLHSEMLAHNNGVVPGEILQAAAAAVAQQSGMEAAAAAAGDYSESDEDSEEDEFFEVEALEDGDDEGEDEDGDEEFDPPTFGVSEDTTWFLTREDEEEEAQEEDEAEEQEEEEDDAEGRKQKQQQQRWKFTQIEPIMIGGEVFKAIDSATREQVALKKITIGADSGGSSSTGTGELCTRKSSLVLSSSTSVEDEATIQAMEQFINCAKDLVHPNLVKYKGLTRVSNTVIYIIQEYVSGGSLHDLMVTREQPLTEAVLRQYCRGLVNALAFLHEHEILHEDIKLTNIMLSNDEALLSDYGVAGFINDLCCPKKNAHFWAGKPPSPERGRKDDVLQLGSCVLELATHGMKRPDLRDAHVSSTLREFINLCTKKNPRDRPDVRALQQHPFLTGRDATATDATVASTTGAAAMSVVQMASASRYKTDFAELEFIGKGSYGEVVKARNNLDGRVYAIKKIRNNGSNQKLTQKILREVTTLSRLNHEHVVRYFQAWLENLGTADRHPLHGSDSSSFDDDEDDDDDEEDEEDDAVDGNAADTDSRLLGPHDVTDSWLNPTSSYRGSNSFPLSAKSDHPEIGPMVVFSTNSQASQDTRHDDGDNDDTTTSTSSGVPKSPKVSQMLYIQMEFCPKQTLRTAIDNRLEDPDKIWKIFRQIVEGLKHIHTQGIIHRDLKPANVFIDDKDDVKIGDFGLSTVIEDTFRTLHTTGISKKIDFSSSLTERIGTPFYTSPECLTSHSYGQKVDIFSLGIILFEMCAPFETSMERAVALTELREKQVFPPGFEAKCQRESQVIRWLLKQNPEERPTAKEILMSPLVPAKLEDEILKSALNEITVPSTTIFGTLMERLFSNTMDDHITQNFDDIQDSKMSSSGIVLRECVFQRIVSVFKTHGALNIEAPLLIPKSALLHHDSAVSLLDETGNVLSLPFDHILPFARYLQHFRYRDMKRYSLGKVYRKRAGGTPKEVFVAEFDIVSHVIYHSVHDAEVIKTATELLGEFGDEVGPAYIRVNHYKLLYAIFEVSHVEKNSVPKLVSLLADPSRESLKSLEAELRAQKYDVDVFETLTVFLKYKGDLTVQLRMFDATAVAKHKHGLDALRELKVLSRNLKAFDVTHKVVLDPCLVHNPNYYDGLVFQVVQGQPVDSHASPTCPTRGDVLMAGGRYDRLVHKFLPQAQQAGGSILPVGAVGVSVAVEKLLALASSDYLVCARLHRSMMSCTTTT
eukprot:TRINITY_DN4639_c0_g1_i2.p1 TRINITY_DN4639_c0_g1~~TRINITY_DN4639_c0_g1_i2.p1  ORF type:complete len:1383 (-),score=422.18 TRINITY_DN4639_c0_g1_i2:93-4241(-)